ncbi:polysaccharide deacetylase family protein [bacterium]|nr:polysaccharide deacetylase family protein [bacterium]
MLDDLPRGLILLYHRVAQLATDPYHLSVSPQVFRSQMQVLADHWPVLTVSQGWQRVQQRQPGCWVAVTFDDAYLDVLEQVWPALREDQSLTLFACTHQPEQEFWWDRLSDPALQPRLRRSPAPRLAAPNTGTATRLNAEQLAWLGHQSQCEMGNHTHQHLSLTALDPLQQACEILQARQLLQQWTGQPVPGLAYPFGDFNDRVRQQAAAHCEWACGVRPGLVWKGVDPYQLPRLWAPNLIGEEFHQWLCTGGLS